MPLGHGLAHCTTGLVGMAAIGAETAASEIGLHFREVLIQAVRIHVPQAELADAGGVDDHAPGEREDLRGGGGVAAIPGDRIDGVHSLTQTGRKRVEQRGLAHEIGRAHV